MHELVIDDVAVHHRDALADPDGVSGCDDLRMRNEGIRQVAYEETEHYRVTKSFLENPKRMLDVLLDRTEDDA